MSSQKIVLMEFEGNPNIGLHMVANDKVCLLGKRIPDKYTKQVEETIQVPVEKISILGTDLVGVFLSMNNEFLITPDLPDEELKVLQDLCEKYDLKLITLDHTINTFGNAICLSEDRVIIYEGLKNLKTKIGKETKLKVSLFNHKTYSYPGSVIRSFKKKYFISHELDETHVKDFVDEIGGVGSINSGSAYISSGIIGNSKGLIIGSLSSTVEIQNVVECFDFL